MTRSDLPPGPELPESTVSELQALYREAAQAEPGAMLDRKILDTAQAELRSAAAGKAKRSPSWWKGWMPAASALAIALVGVSITWQVMDEQERDLRREMKAAEGVREAPVAGSAASAKRAVEAPSLPGISAPEVEKSSRAASVAVKDAPLDMPAPAAAAPMAPAVADEALKKSARAENELLRERRDASAATEAARSPARQEGKLEAGSRAIDSSSSSGETAVGPFARPTANSAAKSAAAPAVDAATPEAWLKQIRALRAVGRNAEAAQSLARFRARYPDFAVPEDLLNLN